TGEHDLRPTPLVESDHEEVAALAARLAPEGDDEDRVEALYDHVADLPDGEAAGALACLREGRGNDSGKSRLLVALCRNRKIPACLVGGLILEGDGTPGLSHWAEAWVEKRWLPMDPSRRRFGASRFPENYLVLGLGDDPVRGEGARFLYGFTVADLHGS